MLSRNSFHHDCCIKLVIWLSFSMSTCFSRTSTFRFPACRFLCLLFSGVLYPVNVLNGVGMAHDLASRVSWCPSIYHKTSHRLDLNFFPCVSPPSRHFQSFFSNSSTRSLNNLSLLFLGSKRPGSVRTLTRKSPLIHE